MYSRSVPCILSGNGSEGFDRPPSDVYSSFSGFVFEEGGYFEGGYEGGSFRDDSLGWGVSALARGITWTQCVRSVCLCVYSRVGASCVGRPTCVCAVWHPSGALIQILLGASHTSARDRLPRRGRRFTNSVELFVRRIVDIFGQEFKTSFPACDMGCVFCVLNDSICG